VSTPSLAPQRRTPPPHRPRSFGLQARFLLVVLIATLITLGLLALALSQQWRGQQELAVIGRDGMRSMVEVGIRQRGETIATQLADSLANPLYYFDLHSVGEIARSALRQPDVSYALVFDPQGRVIHDGSGDIPTFGQPMNDPFAAEAVAATTLRVQQSDALLEVALPIRIGDQPLGGVRVGISMREPLLREEAALDALTQRSRAIAVSSLQWMSFLFLALLGIAALLSIMVARGLVKPIRRLADVARQVESGDYKVTLPSRRSDELGELQRGFLRMTEGIARHEDEVRRLAYSDHLTGLPNRLAFRERLDLRLIGAHAEGASLALVCIDLDDFKRVNDTLGHDAGDEVLEQFAVRLRQCIPFESDPHAQVARFGGDEFVAVVTSTDARSSAHQLAEAVLNELQRPLMVRGRPVFLGASVGITVFPDDATQARDLIKNGDIAMYQAKSAGKNCLRFYSRAMDQAVGDSVALEDALRGAWERTELSVCYQPIYALADRQLVGAEALLRWRHPTLGDVQPATFVEVAERSGLIEPIGRHVLLAACEAAQRWGAAASAPFVSVNVSARQLRSGNLPDAVADVLRQTGLAASRLHVELTETAVLGNEIHASVQLARLRATGVKVWLDDFGTGFSGLSHLRRVPVDGLKIDRSFVADVLQDPDDLALTSAIIAMGHSLGITVVAEGIESEAQFDVLRERGCDHGQGFWLGYPMADAEMTALMVG
jgi:diguanylate cyclase (GGDEF)-like protein